MEDYKIEYNLKKLGDDIRHQTFWGLIPEMPKWDINELGKYCPTISLPAFMQNISVRNGVISFSVTTFEVFAKHTEIYEINTTIEAFTVKLQNLIASQTEKDFCQNLLDVLKTEVYFVTEWDN